VFQDEEEAPRPSRKEREENKREDEDEEQEEGEEKADVEELRAIQLSRTQLESMHDKLFFEGGRANGIGLFHASSSCTGSKRELRVHTCSPACCRVLI